MSHSNGNGHTNGVNHVEKRVRLTHLRTSGAAELCRYILAHGSVDYEDKRISGDDYNIMRASEGIFYYIRISVESTCY